MGILLVVGASIGFLAGGFSGAAIGVLVVVVWVILAEIAFS